MISVQASPDVSDSVHGDQLLMETPSLEPSAQTELENWLIGLNYPSPADYSTTESPEPSKDLIHDCSDGPGDDIQHIVSPKPTK